MRIAHVISNLGIGGAESALCTLIEAPASAAAEHVVVSMLPDGLLTGRLRSAGVDVIEFNGRRSLATAHLLPRIGNTLARVKPDIIQGWMYHGNIAASAAVVFGYTRVPVLWGVRQTVQRLADDRMATRLVILAGGVFGRQPSRIIYNSEQAARDHERLLYPPSKRHVVPNGVDCARFRPREECAIRLRAELGLPPEARLIGRIGRNVAMKDSHTLFAAFSEIRAEVPNVHLVLAGPGMTAGDSELAGLVHRSGLSGSVHFLGPRLDVEMVYPGLDLVISSSKSTEGFSNVIAEAMASGTPVVATDIGETGKIIGARRFLVPPQDADALAHASVSLLCHSREERQAIGSDMRRSIASRFSAEAIASHYIELWTRHCR